MYHITKKLWHNRHLLADIIKEGNIENKPGGGADFLKFIRRKLIPFVWANYLVSKTDRDIAGYSLGGLFTL